jgi:CubicO group peptidase (beta-lactamase class C family)
MFPAAASALCAAMLITGGTSILVAEDPYPRETNAAGATEVRIREIVAKYRIFGLAYLVVKNKEENGYGCFGYADVERKKPMKRTTLFRIASISKPITATAIMQLVQRRRCRLDEDVSRYLGFRLRNPRYPKKIITLRHLLTHTSGITDHGHYDRFLEASYSASPPPLSAILRKGGIYYSKRSWAKHPPGRKFKYTNLGFGVIGTLVERISKTRFDEYCKKNIFIPLGMKASFNIDDFADVSGFAALYSHYSEKERERPEYRNKKEFESSMDNYRGSNPARRDLHGFTPGYNAMIHSPQGGARVSLDDLGKFMSACMHQGSYEKGRILEYWAASYMQRVQWSGHRHDGIYRENGLSFHITRNLVKGVRLVGHSGRAYGFQGTMYFDPVKKNGIIILMNGGDYYRDEKDPLEFHHVETELYRLLHDAYLR